MKTIPAQDIKRRGISAVDDALKEGPVYIIKNNRPQYVILSEQQYTEMREAEEQAYLARVKTSLEDLKTGRVTRGTAEKLIKELGLED
ncbi:MAG: type II toxin-antitoxin system Phd/YefM family antitoxin [Gammaproteobacteria bacterium]